MNIIYTLLIFLGFWKADTRGTVPALIFLHFNTSSLKVMSTVSCFIECIGLLYWELQQPTFECMCQPSLRWWYANIDSKINILFMWWQCTDLPHYLVPIEQDDVVGQADTKHGSPMFFTQHGSSTNHERQKQLWGTRWTTWCFDRKLWILTVACKMIMNFSLEVMYNRYIHSANLTDHG